MSILGRLKRQATILPRHNPRLDIDRLMELEEARWKPRYGALLRDGGPRAAGSLYYQDTRVPFGIADYTSVTLSTTAKQLWPAAESSATYKNDWSLGKKFWVRAFGTITTAATPGNLTISMYYGTADAATTLLASSAALTLIASQTNLSWRFEGYIECRAIGASGSLHATGVFECNTAVIAAGQALIPASAPAAVTCDLTATSGISLQFARSGSTAETAQVRTLVFGALN
jgi:hypothetical protein